MTPTDTVHFLHTHEKKIFFNLFWWRVGSHVSGTVAGVAASGQAGGDSALHSADFNGVAPDARIVFIDAHTSGGGLHIPSPYDAVLFQFAYNYAAMVHTGSWYARARAFFCKTR